MQPDFTPDAMFAMFLYDKITHNSLYQVADKIGVECDLDVAKDVVYRYDRDHDGQINFYEF